jgi:hypothetical protein
MTDERWPEGGLRDGTEVVDCCCIWSGNLSVT